MEKTNKETGKKDNVNQKIYLNALIGEKITRLTIAEKGELVKRIRENYGVSFRQLEKITGIPHTTLVDWSTGRQNNTPGNLHVSINQLIAHFKVYKPKLKEFEKIKELIKVLEKLLEKHNVK